MEVKKREQNGEGTQQIMAEDYSVFGGGCDVITVPEGCDTIPLNHTQNFKLILPQ